MPVTNAINELKQKGIKTYNLPAAEMKKWGERCPDIFLEVANKIDSDGGSRNASCKAVYGIEEFADSRIGSFMGESLESKNGRT